jgi:Chlorite dismutase
MSQLPSPPRVWVHFGRLPNALPEAAELRRDHYRIDALVQVRGPGLDGLEPGAGLDRVEASAPFPPSSGGLIGVTQHLVYTTAPERRELLAISAKETGPLAVVIPIRKSDAWWGLAQDERDLLMRPIGGKPGHIRLGREYAGRIYRRLYHARYAGGSDWDFLTYFEFPADAADEFRSLLRGLRDPLQNPEWAYVERECELWLTRV